MAVKEFIEARWKAIMCGVIALVLVEVSTATYGLFKSALNTSSIQQMPQFLQQQMQQMMSTYDVYVWGNWFAKNGPEILAIIAVVLGAGLIAGEVNKGTIFFLLGKPISRERVLLIKYAVNALENVGVVISRFGGGSYWRGMFSTLFKDALWPLICALVVILLTLIPGFIPDWGAWSLTSYWSNQAVYLGRDFQLKSSSSALSQQWYLSFWLWRCFSNGPIKGFQCMYSREQ